MRDASASSVPSEQPRLDEATHSTGGAYLDSVDRIHHRVFLRIRSATVFTLRDPSAPSTVETYHDACECTGEEVVRQGSAGERFIVELFESLNVRHLMMLRRRGVGGVVVGFPGLRCS